MRLLDPHPQKPTCRSGLRKPYCAWPLFPVAAEQLRRSVRKSSFYTGAMDCQVIHASWDLEAGNKVGTCLETARYSLQVWSRNLAR
jgi:hypothetical protein